MRTEQVLCWVTITLLVLVGCDRSPYPGMTAIGEEIHWELHRLGDGEKTASDSDRVSLTYRIAGQYDTPGSLYSGQRMWVWSGMEARGLTPAMERMHEGDSATIMLPARKVPWRLLTGTALRPPDDTTMIRIDLSLDLVMDAEQAAQQEKSMLRWSEHREEEEQRVLAEHLKAHSIDSTRFFHGIYYMEEIAGNGVPVRMGDLVSIHYRARFLDGTIFDDTRAANTPLVFKLGDPDQIIKGLEIGLQAMEEKSHGQLVIPSSMAFGFRGSAAGIVQPFTTVIYEVEVLEVHGRRTRMDTLSPNL